MSELHCDYQLEVFLKGNSSRVDWNLLNASSDAGCWRSTLPNTDTAPGLTALRVYRAEINSNVWGHIVQVFLNFIYLNVLGPGWCGSVDSVPGCEPNSHRFDSQSAHTPGLWARSQIGGACEATLPPFPPSIPLSLKINK